MMSSVGSQTKRSLTKIISVGAGGDWEGKNKAISAQEWLFPNMVCVVALMFCSTHLSPFTDEAE